ncbi:MAG: hypothetical protein V4714_15640 [Bacteroidota bacterium]
MKTVAETDPNPETVTPYTNTNPDFYETEVADNSQINFKITRRRIIYSTLPNLTIASADYKAPLGEYVIGIDTNKNLTIFALNLTITDTIKIPGGDIKLYCKNLFINTGEATIDVSQEIDSKYFNKDEINEDFKNIIINTDHDGTHGRDGDTLAKLVGKYYGTTGPGAGNIEIACSHMTIGNTLNLLATGGTGYPGGWGGNGAIGYDGDEGKSHVVQEYAGRIFNAPYYKSVEYIDSEPTDGKPGGKGGTAGKGGEGGTGGHISLIYQTENNKDNIKIAIAGGKKGVSGCPGPGGNWGKGGWMKFKVSKAGNDNYQKNPTDGTKPWPQGPKGDEAPSADFGEDGAYNENSDMESSALGNYFDQVFCFKLLQKIKYWYLLNSPQGFIQGEITYTDAHNWEEIKTTLKWLTEVLNNFTDATPKGKILSEANIYWMRCDKNKTYFGDADNFVPRITIEELKKTFTTSYNSRLNFEKTFFSLAGKYDQAHERNISKQEKIQHLEIAKGFYEKAYLDMLKKVKEEKVEVDNTSEELTDAIVGVTKFGDKLKTAITDHFNCKFEDITKGLEMLAFTGITSGEGVLMGGVQLANFLKDGFDTIKVDGQDVDKTYEIDKFTNWQNDLSEITLQGQYTYDSHGEILAEQKMKLLMIDASKMQAELGKLKASLDADILETGAVVLNRLKNTVLKNGEAILTYNLNVAHYQKYREAFNEATEALKVAKDEKQELTPYSTSTVAYYAILYQDMIEKAMEDLYLINRKIFYLTYTDGLSQTLQEEKKESLWLGMKPTNQTVDTLTKKFEDIIRIETNYFANQQSAYQPFPDSSQIYSSVHVKIEDLRLIDILADRLPKPEDKQETDNEEVKVYNLSFSTVYQKPEAFDQLALANVSGSHSIRIDHVQPIVVGATKNLFQLTEAAMTKVKQYNLPAETIGKLQAFLTKKYDIDKTEKIGQDWTLNEKDFKKAITEQIEKEQWAQYGDNIKTAAKVKELIGDHANLTVKIVHQGNSTVLNKPAIGTQGQAYSFMHLPVNCELDHNINIKTETDITGNIIGMKNVGKIDDEFLGTVGIYADWTLTIEESKLYTDNNYGLDMAEVTKVVIYFKGWNAIK